MAGHSRAVEKDEAPYGLNATRARPVSMVQVRHGCLGCATAARKFYTLIRGGKHRARRFACVGTLHNRKVILYVGRLHNGTKQSFDNEACAARSGRKEGIHLTLPLVFARSPLG